MTVRVVLADDQQLIRTALRMVMADIEDVEVVGEASTGGEAVALTEELGPDVVVMDIRMPEMDGIEATRRITEGSTDTRIVVLTTFDDDDYVYGALRAGASGFLVKDMALDDIIGAVRVVASGDALIAPQCDPPPDPGLRGPPRTGPAPPRADGHHGPGARGPDPGRHGPVQHGDSRGAVHQRGDGEDVPDPPADQAGREGPGPAGDHGVRGGAGVGRLMSRARLRTRWTRSVAASGQ